GTDEDGTRQQQGSQRTGAGTGTLHGIGRHVRLVDLDEQAIEPGGAELGGGQSFTGAIEKRRMHESQSVASADSRSAGCGQAQPPRAANHERRASSDSAAAAAALSSPAA